MKEFNGSKISLMLIGLLGMASVSLAAEDTWTQKADMPTARWIHSASVVDGKVYAVGGAGSEPATEAVWPVEVYDPITDTWTQKADIPTGRALLSTSVVDGKIYTIGGFGGTSTVEVYDPATDTWTRKADLPTPRGALSTSVVDGKIYAIGGMTSISSQVGLSTVEVYDPATDTWTSKANLPTPRYALSTSVVDGQIYAIGGASQEPGECTVEAYDPATDTWTIKADMSTARRNFSTSVVAGKIYAIGGWDRSFNYPYATMEQYDPVTDTWTMKADLPEPRSCFSTSVVHGRIYLIGGTFRPHPCPALSTVYELTISPLPVVDFNGDQKVDFNDFAIFAQSAYDDGELDGKGLAALAEYWLEDFRLVAHWKLDEENGAVAHDSAGDNDGTLHGDPNWRPTAGSVDGAIELDGIDDYVSTDFVLDPAEGPFSVFAWVKAGAPEQVVISQVGETGRSWLAADSEGNLMTDLRVPYGRLVGPPLVSDFLITDGDWRRIALVWDGSYRRLHADGGEVAADITEQIGLVGADGGLYFGAENTLSATGFFDGMIDDIRIYNQAVTP